jgi:hypothetical protein
MPQGPHLSLACTASGHYLPEEQGGSLDSHRLAILADALEKAGAYGELVDHLPWPGPHVRVCFAIHLLTGRK